jgi:hypothetical protein
MAAAVNRKDLKVKKDKEVRLGLITMLPLLVNYYELSKKDGHQDIDLSLEDVYKYLNKFFFNVELGYVERLMSAGQIASEGGAKFWHPHDAPFNRIVNEVTSELNRRYIVNWNKEYCTLDLVDRRWRY